MSAYDIASALINNKSPQHVLDQLRNIKREFEVDLISNALFRQQISSGNLEEYPDKESRIASLTESLQNLGIS
jgi:hypothetical protein